jgi:hypothetical protein
MEWQKIWKYAYQSQVRVKALYEGHWIEKLSAKFYHGILRRSKETPDR